MSSSLSRKHALLLRTLEKTQLRRHQIARRASITIEVKIQPRTNSFNSSKDFFPTSEVHIVSLPTEKIIKTAQNCQKKAKSCFLCKLLHGLRGFGLSLQRLKGGCYILKKLLGYTMDSPTAQSPEAGP